MMGRDHQKGFSLLDLMLVIIILSITGLIAMPLIGSVVSAEKVRAAARELLEGISHAENLTLLYGRPFGIGFKTGSNTFEVFDQKYRLDSAPHHHSSPSVDAYGVVLNPYDKSWYRFDFDMSPMTRGVSLTKESALTDLLFYPDGHSGLLSTTITLHMNAFSRQISINGISGRIDVQ